MPITLYPRSDEEAVTIAHLITLEDTLRGAVQDKVQVSDDVLEVLMGMFG